MAWAVQPFVISYIHVVNIHLIHIVTTPYLLLFRFLNL
jgi:hypothetical protein